MLIVLPISQNDFNKPLNVFSFIKALRKFGPYYKHELLIVTRPSATNYANAVSSLVDDLFSSKRFHIFDEDGPSGWPEGPNFYWKNTIEYLISEENKSPWFWMELDCLPLKIKWADVLEEEYYKQGKPCLGTIQDTTTITKDMFRINIAKHLQGTAIYPPRIDKICSIWKYVDQLPTAFDVITQWEIVPNTADTKLIQQGFRTINYKIHNNPFKIQGEDNGDLNGACSYNQPLDPNAVIHHGCKDTSLADIVNSPEYDSLLKDVFNKTP
jgi:hypothetical protein